MRWIARELVPAVAIGCMVMMSTAHHVSAQQPSSITATRLYTGPDGQTYAEQIDVKLAPSTLLDGTGRADVKVKNVRFIRWPPGHVNEWHTPPGGRQYVMALTGRGQVEIINGQRISLEPGRVILAEDLTGKGHLTRTLGSEDWVTVHIYVADE